MKDLAPFVLMSNFSAKASAIARMTSPKDSASTSGRKTAKGRLEEFTAWSRSWTTLPVGRYLLSSCVE